MNVSKRRRCTFLCIQILLVVLSACLLPACNNGSVPLHANVSMSPSETFPAHYFAPYVDIIHMKPFFGLTATAKEIGTRFYTLGSIADGGGCKATWGGTVPLTNKKMLPNDIKSLRQTMKGDVIVSFGGRIGKELALACHTVDSLKTQYQRVIDSYNLTHIDFDIEGDALNDSKSIHQRNQAIALLQENAKIAGKELAVSYTLPAMPSGLLQGGIDLLQDALNAGVTISCVNLLAMNYGSGTNPDKMGEYTIEAITNLQQQLKQLKQLYPTKLTKGLWDMIGVTPMIGQNDESAEIFTLDDAMKVLKFAQAPEHQIHSLSVWSLQRDYNQYVSKDVNSQSGIDQTSYAFASIFASFTSDFEQFLSPPSDGNLVLNPTFAGLGGWQCDLTNLAENNTLRMIPTNNSRGECEQTIANLQPNHKYTLQAYLKGSNPHLEVAGKVYWFSADNMVNYQAMTMTFSTGSATTITIKLYGDEGHGEANAQSVSLLPEASPSNGNLVLNPTFTSLDGWQCDLTDLAENSTLRMIPTNNSPAECKQTVANLQPNHTYTLQAYLKGSNPHLEAAGKVYWFPADNMVNYQAMTITFSTGSETTVTIKLYGEKGHGEADAQNVSLQAQ